ncbi:MAG: glycosyltransferase [Sulfobacillus sp.]
MSAPSVLEVYAGGGVGGAIRHLESLCQLLPGEGLSLQALSMPPHALRPVAEAAGIAVASVDSIAEAARWLGEHPVDVVHTHGLRPALAALQARPNHWVRTVHSLLGSDYRDPLRQAAAAFTERRVIRRVDMTIAISQAVRDDRLRLGTAPGRIQVVWNAVAPAPVPLSRQELLTQTNFPALAQVVMVVARLEVVKGVDQAIAMMSHLDESWHLLVRGEGSERARLAKQVERLGLGDRVALLPYSATVRAEMGAADVLVIPSRQDGFSLVAVEAQAAGVPVVATAVGGLKEAVIGGLLVTPASPPALAAGVKDAFLRRLELGEIGQLAYQRHFSPDRFAAETAAVLRSSVTGNRA